MANSKTLRTLAANVAVAAAYFVAGKIGLRFASLNASASAIWPPTGIALAAVLLLGVRVWPGILIGAFGVNLTTAGTVATSLAIAIGNTLEGVLAGLLAQRFAGGVNAFEKPRTLLQYVALAGLVATTISATFGVTTLAAAGFAPWSRYGAIWLTWWLGDLSGAVIVAPLIVLWSVEPRLRLDRAKTLEVVALLAVMLAVGTVVFGGVSSFATRNYPLAFLCIPVLVWAAFQFTPRVAFTLILVLFAIAIRGTLRGLGPFVHGTRNDSLLILQAFMTVTAVMILAITATVTDRKRIAARLRGVNAELEERVAERTRQLSDLNQELRGQALEHARMQEDLRESETRLRDAQRVARMGSWEWDIESNTVWWSQELYALYGLDPALFGASYEAFLQSVHPEDRDRVHSVVLGAFRDAQPFSFEHRIVKPDGTVLSLHAEGRVVCDERGKPIRMTGTGQDVGERKKLEEQRARLIREQAARREAEEANRQKDDFLAMLSHELRTPLNSIMGWAELLRTGQLDAATTERAIETIRRNVRIQNQLLSDLLDISRMTSGTIAIKHEPVLLDTVIDRALETMRPAAGAKQLRLRAELNRDVPPVTGDASRLEQVVWNLVSNAIEFTPEGGEIVVELGIDGTAAKLCVADNGVGIEPEFLPFVFDRYRQRQGQSSSRKYGGLGLGLAIVKHLVEYHDGTVVASNRESGSGAMFTVRLPLNGAKVAPRPAIDPARAGDEASRPRLDGMKILFVEDEANSREPLALLLGSRGAEVTAVGSAAEAMAALTRVVPDALVSDIEMPGESGYDLIRKVRALPADRGGAVPAIAVTAYAGPDNAARAIRSGYQAHLAKPIRIEELVEVLAELRHDRIGPPTSSRER